MADRTWPDPETRSAWAGTTPLDRCWVHTDFSGHITELSETAAAWLGLSMRGSRGHQLPLFFDRRSELFRDMRTAVSWGLPVSSAHMLKPRNLHPNAYKTRVGGPGDRRRMKVTVEVALSRKRDYLTWTLDR
jgi:hypothetical protein